MDIPKTLLDQWPHFAIALFGAYIIALTYQQISSIYREAKRDYLTRLVSYCENISEIVARIATAEKYPASLIEDFWAYYHGKLVLVEDENLESAMIDYGILLRQINEQNFMNRRSLENPALKVSGACRDLMKKAWRSSITPWKDLQKSGSDASDNAKKS